MNQSNRNTRAVIFCLYILLVAYLCFMRPDELPQVRPDLWGIPIDKVVHSIMFFPYPILAYAAFRPIGMKRSRHIMVLLIILATGAGVAMGTEKLQGLSEYRSYEITDFYADMAGMALSTLLTAAYILIKKTEN
ncbi:MAG: VanZ family protein [Bacteroidales bacterium]|nr:VanZ family protein [Bacteroidales bacterium]